MPNERVPYQHSNDADEQRAPRGEHTGGMRGWVYDNPFKQFFIEVDDVDLYLRTRYITETRNVFKRMLMERREVDCSENLSSYKSTPIQCFRVLLSASLLQKIADSVHRVLLNRKSKAADVRELESLIIMHNLCAAYVEPVNNKNGRSGFLSLVSGAPEALS